MQSACASLLYAGYADWSAMISLVGRRGGVMLILERILRKAAPEKAVVPWTTSGASAGHCTRVLGHHGPVDGRVATRSPHPRSRGADLPRPAPLCALAFAPWRG